MPRDTVSSRYPYVTDRLTGTLTDAVGELRELFAQRYSGVARGGFGDQPKRVATFLFDQWCGQSGVVPFSKAVSIVADGLRRGDTEDSLRRVLQRDMGFSRGEASSAIDRMLADRAGGVDTDAATSAGLWDLYSGFREHFFTQTAHLLLGRLLLYRIGEDGRIFAETISGTALKIALDNAADRLPGADLPSLKALLRVARELESFLPIIYKPGTLDWWVIDDEHQRHLGGAERRRLATADAGLDGALEEVLLRFDTFSFATIDVDVWREVYQRYLPKEERQRLGGFYTPEHVVDLMLDLAGYEATQEGLCGTTLLDFASGSGTFSFQAAGRLLAHLDLPLNCHPAVRGSRTPKWVRARLKLEVLQEHIYAVDIHVFAAFLTTLNLLFQALPLLLEARRHAPDLSYDPHVFAHDTLEKPREIQRAAKLWEEANSRVALSEENIARYREANNKRFDFVVGNPPWGGVLKGRLSPLFDPERRAAYKAEYPEVATGKFNIYSLFFQRGVEWLRDGGRLAVITENKFLGHDFGAGVRGFLSENTTISALIDLEEFGQLFFDAMNTPCITIATRGSVDSPPDCAVVQVRTPDIGLPATGTRDRIAWVTREVRRAIAELEGTA